MDPISASHSPVMLGEDPVDGLNHGRRRTVVPSGTPTTEPALAQAAGLSVSRVSRVIAAVEAAAYG